MTTTRNAWFRLLIRGLGVFFIGLSVPRLVETLLNFVRLEGFSGWRLSDMLEYGVASAMGPLLQLGFGLYLLFMGEALIRRCLADLLDRCPACQYDIRATTTNLCPECGATLPPRRPTTPPPASPDGPSNPDSTAS